MKKKYVIWICAVLIALVIGFVCIYMYNNNNNNNNNINNVNMEDNPKIIEEKDIEKPKDKILEEQIDIKISKMSLREKIGQMLVISSWDFGYSDKLDKLLTEVKPGGFILFENNIGSYKTATEYIAKIKSTASIPMIIGIDQEGGKVQKIKNLPDVNVMRIPNMYDLGKTNDSELSYNVGKVMAEELSAFGINLDFAPVLDIFSNPNNTVIGYRAFGNDANVVINMALPFAKGMKENGIIPVYKHFPGHGDTDTDSHVELPVITKTKEELYQKELLTFRAAIKENAEMIMTAHIALPNITGSYIPATLSKEIINDILREELGFNGVIITDAINMKALSSNYSLEQICSYTINAGVDMILMPNDPLEALNTIEKLVNNKTIDEKRINESVKRILLLKYSNKLDQEKTLNVKRIGTQEHIDIINKIIK